MKPKASPHITKSPPTLVDISSIPTNPGCYIYKNSANKIIYIGKAKNLKKRVTSYFTKRDHDPKTEIMITHIHYIETIITKNEIEALILENTLIKKHRPKYNIDLKDSRSYAYIELTNEKFPKFKLARYPNTPQLGVQRTMKHSIKNQLFGPFTSAKARDDILQVINRTFKLRTCNKLPKRACLRYSIGICSAPCINQISEEQYNENIKSAKLILKGEISKTISLLKTNMQIASKRKDYERALNFRNQIDSLEYLKEKQNMQRNKNYNEDIINYITKDNIVYIAVFNIYKGTLENKQEFTFEQTENFLEKFLTQYYLDNEIPKQVILPKQTNKLIQEYLSKKANKVGKVETVVPKIGEKKELLELVKKNIEISFFGDLDKLNLLKRLINLQETPHVIECFDISHLSGTNIVASMVQFRMGKPDKSNYRRYKLKTVTKNDDYASMQEVVRRRYTKLKLNREEFPNLIVIDGGLGQLNSALQILDELNLKIPIISLAKEFEEIHIPGQKKPIRLDKKNKARLLLQQIRDESHRFAIKYNRLLRKKEIRK
jgi:excinuclease ABC subunit C